MPNKLERLAEDKALYITPAHADLGFLFAALRRTVTGPEAVNFAFGTRHSLPDVIAALEDVWAAHASWHTFLCGEATNPIRFTGRSGRLRTSFPK